MLLMDSVCGYQAGCKAAEAPAGLAQGSGLRLNPKSSNQLHLSWQVLICCMAA